MKKGIIVIEPKTPRLNYLRTELPFILIYGKPLIHHHIENLIDAEVFDIVIVIPNTLEKDLRGQLGEFFQERAKIKVSIYLGENYFLALKNILANTEADDHHIIFTGLISEKNPHKFFLKKKKLELLIDKNLLHNKFSGARNKVKTGLFGIKEIGPDITGYNAELQRAYYMNKEGAQEIARIMDGNPDSTLEKAIMEWGLSNKIGILNHGKYLWYEINSPETAIRAEMLFRRKKENARPTEVKTDRFIYPDTSLHFRYEKSRETPVIIEQGILDRIDTLRLMDRDRTASHHIMITDTVVDRLVGKKVEEKLTKAGYSLTKIIAPSGEAAKTMNVYHELSEKITSIGIDEQSVIFSLGGGAIANLAGFLAATLYRGIGLIHIPTSLMCMNDVAISLKQGINNQKGKNLVGSYYQPLLVVIDPSVPMNETIIRHGMSETIKHALAEDVAFFDYLLSYNGDLKDVNFLEKIIRHTIELKIGLMNDDMFENARAIILQYGHEVGHAIEYLSHFGLTHGEAISIGMRVSAEISHLMGVTSEDTVYAHKKILEHYKLPYIIPQTIEKRAILDALRFNKKTRGNDIRFALLEHVGKIWKIKGEYGIPCPVEIIEEAIRRSYE